MKNIKTIIVAILIALSFISCEKEIVEPKQVIEIVDTTKKDTSNIIEEYVEDTIPKEKTYVIIFDSIREFEHGFPYYEWLINGNEQIPKINTISNKFDYPENYPNNLFENNYTQIMNQFYCVGGRGMIIRTLRKEIVITIIEKTEEGNYDINYTTYYHSKTIKLNSDTIRVYGFFDEVKNIQKYKDLIQ